MAELVVYRAEANGLHYVIARKLIRKVDGPQVCVVICRCPGRIVPLQYGAKGSDILQSPFAPSETNLRQPSIQRWNSFGRIPLILEDGIS